MNKNVIDDLINVNSNLIVPSYLIKFYSYLNITDYDFIVLLYFINQKDDIPFDVSKISKNLYIEESKVLEIITSLTDKKYISIEIKKNNGIIEEYISLELFYNKIKLLLIENKSVEKNSDIYSTFEQEFGRTLSPVEYETITNWIECNIPIELIKEALKEAILSGVSNIRYIDKILFEWNKKGYKKREDIVKKSFKENDEIEELYDYDWLNE